jgi:signal transduction histidine kinase
MDDAENTINITSDKARPGSPDTNLNGAETRETALEQRNRSLEREVSERDKALERSQQNLQSVLSEIDLIQDRERKQLAADLHDYLTQLLVLGHMKTRELKRLTLPPKGPELVQDVEGILKEGLQYCRTLLTELSPIANEKGLAADIQSLSAQMERYGLEVTVETNPDDLLSVSKSSAALLFRSVRELLINTVKHGAAKRARVRMTCENGCLHIVVSDIRGTDLAAPLPARGDNALSSGTGLLFIRERMEALDGRFDFESVPSQGTTATLIVPMRNLAVPPGP